MIKFNTLLLMVLSSTAVYSAQNGTLGVSSTASANITFTKHALVRVSQLDDFNLNKPSSLRAQVWHDDICVTSTSGAYKVVTYSQKGGGERYKMSNSTATKSIDYSINFSTDSHATEGDALMPGVESAIYTTHYSDGCAGGVNSRVFLSVDKISLEMADPDEYADVLTFIVHPI